MDAVRMAAIEIVLEMGVAQDVDTLLIEAAKVEAYLRGRPGSLMWVDPTLTASQLLKQKAS